MYHASTLIDLEARIAAIRENIRELTEQAAAYSGATDEARTADQSPTGKPAGRSPEGARGFVGLAARSGQFSMPRFSGHRGRSGLSS